MTEDFMGSAPEIAEGAWIHPTAVVIGKVKLCAGVSVWPGAVVRGDVEAIEIGKDSNIQDLAVLHPDRGRPVVLGEGVTVGHSAVVHGSRVGGHCLIGMGAIVMGAEIGEFSLVGAGALLPPGSVVPPGSMVLGVPGKVVRALTESEKKSLIGSKEDYLELAGRYKARGA